jgi:hypothetical protein
LGKTGGDWSRIAPMDEKEEKLVLDEEEEEERKPAAEESEEDAVDITEGAEECVEEEEVGRGKADWRPGEPGVTNLSAVAPRAGAASLA